MDKSVGDANGVGQKCGAGRGEGGREGGRDGGEGKARGGWKRKNVKVFHMHWLTSVADTFVYAHIHLCMYTHTLICF